MQERDRRPSTSWRRGRRRRCRTTLASLVNACPAPGCISNSTSLPISLSSASSARTASAREEVVVAGEVAADRRGEARPVGRVVAERRAVERRGPRRSCRPAAPRRPARACRPCRSRRRRPCRPCTASCARRKSTAPPMSRAARSIGSVDHEVAGLVHLGVLGDVAVVQVGREGDEALAGERGRTPAGSGGRDPTTPGSPSRPGPEPESGSAR